MADHLGYERGDRARHGSGNSRNWAGRQGAADRCRRGADRGARRPGGTFAPALIPEHSRRRAGFDQAVLSLYAKGMTTGDIAAHLAGTYGSEVSRERVSKVTDAGGGRHEGAGPGD
jgi:putative transposase